MNNLLIEPSILSADFSHLGEEVERVIAVTRENFPLSIKKSSAAAAANRDAENFYRAASLLI